MEHDTEEGPGGDAAERRTWRGWHKEEPGEIPLIQKNQGVKKHKKIHKMIQGSYLAFWILTSVPKASSASTRKEKSYDPI